MVGNDFTCNKLFNRRIEGEYVKYKLRHQNLLATKQKILSTSRGKFLHKEVKSYFCFWFLGL